jgi:hypothetical protein
MCARCKYKELITPQASPTSGQSEEGEGAIKLFAENTKGPVVTHRALLMSEQPVGGLP